VVQAAEPGQGPVFHLQGVVEGAGRQHEGHGEAEDQEGGPDLLGSEKEEEEASQEGQGHPKGVA
jgi:hypothetical protein